jgi:hypothetical protein
VSPLAFPVGSPIVQPGLLDTNLIDMDTICDSTVVQPVASLTGFNNSTVDAAIALVNTGAVDTSGSILEFGTNGSAAPPANTTTAPGLRMTVAKSGRTTGVTCGTIESITFTDGNFKNQVVINSEQNAPTFSDEGDSGSLIVDAATAQPVALLWGGNASTNPSKTNLDLPNTSLDVQSIGNPIGDVLAAFHNTDGTPATIVGGAQHAITCPPESPGFNPSTGAVVAQAKRAAPQISAEKLALAKSVKEAYEQQLLSDPAVIGVGVTYSKTHPGEPAILVLVERGKPHNPIPDQLDGIEVEVRESGRFRPY